MNTTINMRDTSEPEPEPELDDATIRAMNEGEDQGDRGEGVELSVLKEQWKAKLSGR